MITQVEGSEILKVSWRPVQMKMAEMIEQEIIYRVR